MNPEKVEALNPVETVTLSTGKLVEVREMAWKDYIAVTKRLTSSILGLLGPSGKDVVLNEEVIVKALTEQEQNLTIVLMKSTNLAGQAEVDALNARDAMRILKVAIKLNLNEEVIGLGKDLAARMGEVFALKTRLPGLATSSSPTATP